MAGDQLGRKEGGLGKHLDLPGHRSPFLSGMLGMRVWNWGLAIAAAASSSRRKQQQQQLPERSMGRVVVERGGGREW